MAVIEKIRQRTGLLIIIIGLALVSFLVSDAISSNMGLFQSQDNTVGEIDGVKISYQDYSAKIETVVSNLENQGQEVNEFTREMIREQVWNEYFQKMVIDDQYNALGLMVTGDEVFAAVTNPIDLPQIRDAEAFKNQTTQQFDPSLVVAYLKQIDQDPSGDAKRQWVQYENEGIKPLLVQKKYNTLLTKAVYRTSLEVKAAAEESTNTVDVKFAGFNFNSIPDDSVSVTDEEMLAHLKANAKLYKQEAKRKIEYVLFDILPSSEDTAKARQWITDKKGQFEKTNNDTVFIRNNSDIGFDTTFKARGTYPANVETALYSANVGEVVGPFFSGGKYSIYKVLAFNEDTNSYARGSQIILKPNSTYDREDTLRTVARANALAALIRAGGDFEQFAKDSSQDTRTGSRGGDLGWVKKGSGMFPEAVDRVLFSNSVGGIAVVTTSMGVHIVKVTEAPSRRTVMVGQIDREVTYSSATESEVYNEAYRFASESRQGDAFAENAEKSGYLKRVSPDLAEGDKSLPNIDEARDVIRWAFNEDTKLKGVSEVIAVGDKYLVAQLVSIKEEGTPKIDDIRDQLQADTRKAKKAEIFKKRIEDAMAGGKTIEELALSLKIIVNNSPATLFTNTNLPYVGNDPKLTGAIMGAEANKLFGPIEGTTGVYVFFVTNRNEVPFNGDVRAEQNRVMMENSQEVANRAFEALKKSANIEDYRFRFF